MSNYGFAKGMAIGLFAGAAIGCAVMPKTKDYKRRTGKFLKAAGEIIENISGMWS